jgi:hypothetical protein
VQRYRPLALAGRISATGQNESLAKRKLPVSERLLVIEADVHGPLLNDGRTATAANGLCLVKRPLPALGMGLSFCGFRLTTPFQFPIQNPIVQIEYNNGIHSATDCASHNRVHRLAVFG